MKQNLLFFNFLFSFVVSLSQTNKSTLNSSSESETILTFNFDKYKLQNVETPKGVEQIVVAENTSAIMIKGMPDLPKFTESLIIPDLANMKIEILFSKFKDYSTISIAPSKGNFDRTILPKDVTFEYGRAYSEDIFFPKVLAKLESPYIMRDFRGAALQVNPFQYNPVRKTLRVYSEIKLRIYSDGQIGENTLNRVTSLQKIDTDFNNIYSNHFINYETRNTSLNLVGEEGKMLIICHDAWMSLMLPFVNWKNSIGRPTELVSVSTAGNTAALIRNYVSNYYNTKGLTYLLLVGDAAQVPTNTGVVSSGVQLGGHSDNAYAYISGNDHYQEFFVGRFSAETEAQVVTQVQRTVSYEKGDQLAPNWLNKIVSVASSQGPGDDNEMDYQHLRNIQPDLLGFTYQNPVYEFFDGSQGGQDLAGDPSAASVSNALNNGAGIINYVGHGSDVSWGTSGFSGNDVNNLTNNNKLPFIFDVACVNGNFVGQTSFSEYWMRAQVNNQPTGAIAICASTINQSWSPPMVAQDEMNDILVGIATTGIKKTFGGIIVNGFFKMNDETSDFNMTDTWTCFGDPSLLVRTDNPTLMTVSHNSNIVTGAQNFIVNCNFNGALATISNNSQIVGSSLVINGIATIQVSGLVPGQLLKLTVIGFNKVTNISEITVINSVGSFLVVDTMANSIDFGQTKNLNISIKNIGLDNASSATAQISTANLNATLTNNNFSFGNILASASTTLSSNAFTLQVANNLTDQYPVEINIQINDSSNIIRNETKSIYVNAPKFAIGSMIFLETSGDNNGFLDPGETGIIKIEVVNTGHASVTNVIGSLSSNNSGLIFNNTTTLPTTMSVNGNQIFEFSVTASIGIVVGTAAELNFGITGGVVSQYTNQKLLPIAIGYIPSYCQAGADNVDDEYISNVVFSGINNTSLRATAYTNFTNKIATITRGQTYPISVTNGEHYTQDQMGCWIDWNYDGDFTDANEFFALNYSNSIGSGTVAVPLTARIGSTRMRLRVMYSGQVLPCGNTNYGEVEDYTVNVTNQNLESQTFKVNALKVYPNPSNGKFILEVGNENIGIDDAIEIYTINGQLIYSKSDLKKYNEIALEVSKGIYLLKLKSAESNSYKKIIVE